MTTLNPYALDEAVVADGIDLYDPRAWDKQVAERQTPVSEGENPGVHFVHVNGCRQGGEFYVTWCGIAVDREGRRSGGMGEDGEPCLACVSRMRASARCPVCDTSIEDIVAREEG